MNPRTIYVECDIPPGMTFREYRRLREANRRRRSRHNRIRLPRRRSR